MAIVKKYLALVEQVKNPLPDIFTITFSSEKKFHYYPGQFLHLALEAYDGIGQWPESRCFSIQSSPDQSNLSITFAVKGDFTRRMTNLKFGDRVWLKLPYGEIFTHHQSFDNSVFIAGGTGITPFISLFTYKSFKDYIKPKLYFGLRTEEYNIFTEELNYALQLNNNFDIKIIYQDQKGLLDIKRIYNQHPYSNYFISGPPQMIRGFKRYLLDNQVPQMRIITDDWE